MKNISILLLFIGSISFIQATPKKNICGNSGVVFPKDKLRMVVKYGSLTKDTAYNGNDKVNDSKKRILKFKQTMFAAKGGLGNKFEYIALIPYVSKTLNQTAGGKNFDMTNSGLADISLITRYSLSNQKKGDFAFTSVGFGIKLPTGSTNKTFYTPKGIKNPNQTQTLQLGSGSYDYIGELGFTKFIKTSRVDASINYTHTTNGDNDYRFGNRIKWNIGYLNSINDILSVQLELDGIYLKKNRYKNKYVDSSGGKFICITPGFQIQLNKNIDLSIGYSKMIKRDNNYDSANKIGGLSEDHRLLVRLGYIF